MEKKKGKITFDKEEHSYEFLFGEKIDASMENSFDVVDFFFTILVALVSHWLFKKILTFEVNKCAF